MEVEVVHAFSRLAGKARRVVVRDVARVRIDTFYRWKKVYGGLEPSEARRLKQLEDENAKLKRLVAELTLDKTMLQDVVRKKW